MNHLDDLKQQAAAQAITYVESGMVLGLGSGSTTARVIALLGQKYQSGELTGIAGVPSSERSAMQARGLGIPLTTLAEHPLLDLAIDGADEVDPDLTLTKGLGGALLREKIVAVHARRLVIVVDGSKLVSKIGTRAPLPVELVPFGWEAQARWLQERLDCQPRLRLNGATRFITDNHNYILDCHFSNGIDSPAAVAEQLERRPGIVEHGLFIGMASEVIVAAEDGLQRLVRRTSR